jgi:23S rRNA G2445 N2-methylase RlmL
MPRPPLEQAVRDPGFTPSLRDLGGLVDLLLDEDLVKHVERALARLGGPAVGVLRARYEGAAPALRARIVRAMARLGGAEGTRAFLLVALDDADPKTRRNAAIALGHTAGEGVEAALLGAWQRDPRPEMRRSIAASLGKIGGSGSLEVLRQAARAEDAELVRIAERATMMITRTESRADRGRLDAARAPAGPVAVEVLARRGLERLLVDELAAAPGVSGVGVSGPGRVRAQLDGPMGALFAARTMLAFRFPLPTEWTRAGEPPIEALARAATGPEAARIFSAFTQGPVRYRLAWAEGGHKRATAWDAARAIAARAPELVNDPTASLWELHVAMDERFVDVALEPRALDDPRFTWRRRDVPAASHPTIAAALVRVAGVMADDVVWDPFVGAGGELAERGLAGPYRSLRGSDVDGRAVDAARENLRAAGVSASIEQADGLGHAPPEVTLVITNPPMGRRAVRTGGIAEMLDRFVSHAASALVPRGRLVWLAPFPARSRAVAERAGLHLDWAETVDMGGFDAEMQRWIKT